MRPSPNAVLSDIHQIPSGVDTTVAVLGVLSNHKSRVCIPGRRYRRPLTGSAPLKDSTLPASVCVGRGSAIGAGPSSLARIRLAGGDCRSRLGSTDCRSARASMPFVICSTGDALAFKAAAVANQTSATYARGKDGGSARGSRRNFLGF